MRFGLIIRKVGPHLQQLCVFRALSSEPRPKAYRFHPESPDSAAPNNTYKAIRLISKHYNLYYSVWCNNEHELYDLTVGFFFFIHILMAVMNNMNPQFAARSSPTTQHLPLISLSPRSTRH